MSLLVYPHSGYTYIGQHEQKMCPIYSIGNDETLCSLCSALGLSLHCTAPYKSSCQISPNKLTCAH
jgi:hypothetical protein